jgi:KipI family sensor histidine kinase inhibitor
MPAHPTPLVLPLGDGALVVRFGETLTDGANRAAIGLAAAIGREALPGALEIVPNLVSVLVRYDPDRIGFERLSGEIALLVARGLEMAAGGGEAERIPIRYDGADLESAAAALGLAPSAFVERHATATLRVLAVGFAPGFIYCGMHGPELTLPRRTEVRARVPAGTVLFAAGQTAISATEIPTGWHVIGHTVFRNFNADAPQPLRLRAGDSVRFEAVA